MRKHSNEKVHGSHLVDKDVKGHLENFARYSRKTESEIIADSLMRYFRSNDGFKQLMEVELARRQWCESLYDDCADYQNLVCDKNLLLGRG